MKKIIFLIFSFLLLIFSWVFSATASTIQVENIFSDIDTSYEYYDELQELYDRWMISPDSEWKFSPYSLLERDEFVGISMEVACERCIQPHTEAKFIEDYWGKDIYFDIQEENNYFYCIADADKRNFVKGYDAGFICENGLGKDGERPFCPQNTITLEESIAVLLRNSGVFTIEDNQEVMQNILAGNITESLSNDVSPTNSDGSPYTFYGYLRRALDFELTEFDTDGNEKTYKMLEVKDGKIRPKKWITKEEFLLIAYISFKSNSCASIEGKSLALRMNILPSSCTTDDTTCSSSDTTEDNQYDFSSQVWGECEEWIEEPNSYIWRFQNTNTWDRFFQYGKYLDNVNFSPSGNWTGYLRVIDRCGNTWEVYTTFVSPGTASDMTIDIEAETTNNENGGWVADLEWIVEGWNGPYIYEWDFGDGTTGTGSTVNHEYDENGNYLVTLTVTDVDGNQQTEVIVVSFVGDESNDNITVNISVDNIIWPEDLLVWTQWIIEGWVWPYTYEWDFGDNGTWVWPNQNHLYDNPGVYEITLIVTDSEWSTWEATVLISVTPSDSCEKDSDGDWLPDCEDKCPSVIWDETNNGCPILDDGTLIAPTLSDAFKDSCLYSSNEATIFWNAFCNSCPCTNFLDFLADIRKCDIIFPAITSPDASTIYSKWNSVQIK